MIKQVILLLIFFFALESQSQIIIDNLPPYSTPSYLVDNVLLGGGVTATNHVFQGAPSQIGWFNAINTNLGIDSGIVMSTEDIYALDPIFGGSFPIIPNTVIDPDLLAVANSVPPLLPAPHTNSFNVSSVNDIAILEFDFIATSDSMEFRYAFGSQEYFSFENTQYNDVFGFFLSGPGINGPWANGAVNLAIVPNTNPALPITISSINSVTPINQQYFVDNQAGLSIIADVNGFTNVLTAKALVQCGATYHIKLAIADGSDNALSSYVWLEAGSFTSPELQVLDNLGIDSTVMNIACGDSITLTANVLASGVTYEWYDSTSSVFSTDSFVNVGAGAYTVSATYPGGCIIFSDTLEVISADLDSLPPTLLECVAISNDMLYFDWQHPLGASSVTNYRMLGSTNLGGPYYNLANAYYPTNTYSIPLSSIPTGTQFYYITTAAECLETLTSDTITPISFSVNYSDVNCWDDTDGYIGVDVHSVQLAPYSYYLNGILNTNAYPYDTSFYGLSSGTYNVTVSDNAFCSVDVPITISAPGYPLQALVSSSTNTCYGSDLAIAVGSSAGGTPGYSYEWFDSGMNSFSTNDTAFALSAGSYYLEVMDANGCDTFTVVNVIEPQVPLTSSAQVFNVICKGDSTGMIVGDAAGSWAPYTYYWLDMQGDTLQESTTHISTRDTLFNLSFGSYQLHIEDFEGCRVEYIYNIDEPDNALSIDSMKVISDISCYGDSVGIARMYVSGGDPVYSYLWDNGENSIIASSLTSGYHTATLTDDWGCEVIDSIFISENTLIESDLLVHTTVSCYGASDGIATISSIGGASTTYTYFWSQGQQTVGVNLDTASGLLHGSYYVITRDILGCEVIDSVYISQPDPLVMEASELDWIDCFGYNNGVGIAVAQAGTAPYLFDWNNDGIADGDTVNNLTPGIHLVSVTDSRGCTATDTILTHEPPLLYVNIDDLQTVLPYCLGVNTASLSALAGGGTPDYTYLWDDNSVQPQTTTTATSLLAGTYVITVTDSKGCTATDTSTILNTDSMSSSVVSLINYIGGSDISCYGEDDGQALVIATGGHAPYSYQWYGPNGYVNNTDTIGNLFSGVYSVTVRDTNDCTVNSSIVITEPTDIFFTTLGSSNETCFGACDGSVEIGITGGVSPYVAIATDNTTGNAITILMGMGNDSIVDGICSGTYTLTFVDENGCPSTLLNGGVDQQSINANYTTVAEINTSNIVDILCNGSATGVLEVLNPNTSAGYTYSWQDLNGNIVGNTNVASNLFAGTYVLHADYNNIIGCTSTDTAIVSELPAINSSVTITNVDCFGNSTGMLQGFIQGGTSPYDMLWNPGGILGATANGLQVGLYTLTVTDSNNCQRIDTFEITQPLALSASIDSIGYVLEAVVPTGGTSPYSYSWREQLNSLNEIGTGINYIVSSYGTYYVIVTDANGCESISNTITYEAGALEVSSLADINLRVYPNPFREETTIDFGRVIDEVVIKVVDVYGKLIELHELQNIDKYILERNNKASGVYFLEFELINQEYLGTFKLIIE